MNGGLGLVAKEYSILFYAAYCTEYNQKHAPLLGSGCGQIPAGNHTPTHRTIILLCVPRQSQSKAFNLGLQQSNTSKSTDSYIATHMEFPMQHDIEYQATCLSSGDYKTKPVPRLVT